MKNIPLILPLGKTLTEYAHITSDHRTFTSLINQHFPPDQLQGHKAIASLLLLRRSAITGVI